jgi:tetratricopeptide (TPR) repeat protein
LVRARTIRHRVAAAGLSLAALAAPARGASLDAARRAAAALARADIALDRGDLEPAAALYREALDAADAPGASELHLARALDGLADVRHRQGRLAQAAELYERSLPVWERLLGDGRVQPRLAVTLHNLGAVHVAAGQAERARPLLERALAIWEATLGSNSPEAIATRRLLVKAEGAAATPPERAGPRPRPGT